MSICGKEVTEVAQPHPHQQLAGDYNYETRVYTFSMGGKREEERANKEA